MTWTTWRAPQQTNYWTDSGIEFAGFEKPLDRVGSLISLDPLTGTTCKNEILPSGSRGLIFTHFGFDVSTALAVEVAITADRMARIVDSAVQLWQGSTVGNNVADLDMSREKVYSGSLKDYWRCSVNPSSDNFGVLLDFAPRLDMPSSNKLILRSVTVRIQY